MTRTRRVLARAGGHPVIFDHSAASFLYRIRHELLSEWVGLCVLQDITLERETEQWPNTGRTHFPPGAGIRQARSGSFFCWPFRRRARCHSP
jgi:hypothetical protein